MAALFTREFFEAARAPPGAGRRHLPVGEHLQHQRPRPAFDCRDFHVGVSRRNDLAGRRERRAVCGRRRCRSIRAHRDDRAWLVERLGIAGDLESVGAVEPFSLLSLFAGGPAELARYGEGAAILDDDRMTLEFSAPGEVHGSAARECVEHPAAARRRGSARPIRAAFDAATAVQWRNRGAMMFRSDFFATAYDDYLRALARDPSDAAALDGFARSAIMARRATDALADLKERPAATPAWSIARSKLLAASGAMDAALAAAEQASSMEPVQVAALDRKPRWSRMPAMRSSSGSSSNSSIASPATRRDALLRSGVAIPARRRRRNRQSWPEQAVAADPAYAPTYDLLGAAQTKLGQTAAARTRSRRRCDSTRTTAPRIPISACWSSRKAIAPPQRDSSPRRCGWTRRLKPLARARARPAVRYVRARGLPRGAGTAQAVRDGREFAVGAACSRGRTIPIRISWQTTRVARFRSSL